MKTIVFNISGNRNGTSPATSAIKVFLSKNKKHTHIYAVGNQKDINVLGKGDEHLTPVSAYNEGDSKPTQDDYVSRKAWECFQSVNADVFITFDPKEAVRKQAEANLTKVSCPAFVTRFLSSTPNRFCLLGDCGYYPTLSAQQYQLLFEQLKDLAANVFSLTNPTVALLGPGDKPDNLSENLRNGYDVLEGKPGFTGLIGADSLLEGKNDILLTDGILADSLIKGIYAIYDNYNSKYQKYRKDDFLSKMAFVLGRKMIQNVNSLTSARLDQSGYFVLGFNKLIIKANADTNMGGIIGMLDNVQNYLFSLPI